MFDGRRTSGKLNKQLPPDLETIALLRDASGQLGSTTVEISIEPIRKEGVLFQCQGPCIDPIAVRGPELLLGHRLLLFNNKFKHLSPSVVVSSKMVLHPLRPVLVLRYRCIIFF